MSLLNRISLVIAFSFAATSIPGHANGDGVGNTSPAGKACAPVRTNTFVPLHETGPTAGTAPKPGSFEPWPMTVEQTKLGFIARRSDGAFLVVPNKLAAKNVFWIRLVRGKSQVTCASRIVVTFQSDTEPEEVKLLADIVKSSNPKAQFVRPIMRGTQVEWTIPFVGFLHRFNPAPTFPLGGLVIVWDIDRQNTQVLERFLKSGPQTFDIPGVLMMQEVHTGLLLNITLVINSGKLVASQYAVPIDH